MTSCPQQPLAYHHKGSIKVIFHIYSYLSTVYPILAFGVVRLVLYNIFTGLTSQSARLPAPAETGEIVNNVSSSAKMCILGGEEDNK